jgi:hypothetical protein
MPELRKAQDALNTYFGYLRPDDGHPVRIEVSDALLDLRARLHGVLTQIGEWIRFSGQG